MREVKFNGNIFLIDRNNNIIDVINQSSENLWEYTIDENENTAILNYYIGPYVETLIIPNYIDGIRVLQIQAEANGNILEKIDTENKTMKLEISDGIEYIRGFYNCECLVGDLKIPNSVVEIGTDAFRNCNSLNGRLVLGNNIKQIGINSFYGCSSLIGDLIIPDSVEKILVNAFYACGSFDGNIKIGNSVQIIETNAFYLCEKLKGDLILPESVKSIGDNAFAYCMGLDGELKILSDVTIPKDAFHATKWKDLIQ